MSFNVVVKNGNNVKATFDFVERIVRLVAFDNVASTLLMEWTGLILHVTRKRDRSQTTLLHCIIIKLFRVV